MTRSWHVLVTIDYPRLCSHCTPINIHKFVKFRDWSPFPPILTMKFSRFSFENICLSDSIFANMSTKYWLNNSVIFPITKHLNWKNIALLHPLSLMKCICNHGDSHGFLTESKERIMWYTCPCNLNVGMNVPALPSFVPKDVIWKAEL